ncbi:MAG: ribosome-associated translation inhibitor RaiA [Acidobacteria bacterium]|nr:ribosome-associated translation inhibitor RaiA [Acidobacteriota bacterium]
MKLEITGRHLVVTPALRTYLERRLRKFTKIFGDGLHCHVVIDAEKGRHAAEIVLRSKILNIAGKGETSDLYASILKAVDKLERQALRHKAKIIETKRQRARDRAEAEKSDLGRGARPGAVRRDGRILEEEVRGKPMAVEEAVLQLGESEYPFVVFRNVESGNVNVLYRRRDGSLGLIYA